MGAATLTASARTRPPAMPRPLSPAPALALLLALAACTATPPAAPDPVVVPGGATADVSEPAPGAPPAAAPMPDKRARVQPYPVMPPPRVRAAVERGTRTERGVPGPAYWQHRVRYDLDAALDAETGSITGSGTLSMENRSPDAIPFVVLKLRQNVHAPGVPRNRPAEVTGGMTLDRLALVADGSATPLAEADGLPSPGEYAITGTVLTLHLPTALAPGATVTLDAAWRYRLATPEGGTFRQGWDGEVAYVGYWYPQFAVHDDLGGWHTDPYLGSGEHYMPYGDYSLRLTAPRDYLVWSTGTLTNEAEVLTPRTRARLARARSQDAVTSIVGADERGTATAASATGTLTWAFEAENVRDVAWSASARYLWDATRALVDQDGDGAPEAVGIHAFYRPAGERPMEAPWERSAEFSRHSIEHLSETLWPYPYAHMTAVEGLIGGGMEFPMMTLVGGNRDAYRLYSVTYHEIAHMWFPMLVGTNEKAYTWIDEGLTSFHTNRGLPAFFDGSSELRPAAGDVWARRADAYAGIARTGDAIEPMRHNDRFRVGGGTVQVDRVQGSARVIASYSVPALLFRAMEGVYGAEAVESAIAAFGEAWTNKHPTPYDFFDSMEASLGEDLDWLWTPILFETWTIDHAVGAVAPGADGVAVTVRDLGLAPVPATVRVTYADGRTASERVPVQTWLDGATEATLRFPAGTPTRVEIDPERTLPDVNRANNAWDG